MPPLAECDGAARAGRMYNEWLARCSAMAPVLILLCIAAIVVAGLVLEYFSHRETYRPDRKRRQPNPRRTDSSGDAD